MKYWLVFFLGFLFIHCKKENNTKHSTATHPTNLISHANHLKIYDFKIFYKVEISQNGDKKSLNSTYIFSKNINELPDILKKYQIISIPVKRLIPTSTTHISSIGMLEKESSIVGFPHLDYISSEKVLSLVAQNKISEVADKEAINIEKTIDLQPDVIVAHWVEQIPTQYSLLQNAGIPTIYNADWVEETPLGKAEWIKFFGILYDDFPKATQLFDTIVKEYTQAKAIAKTQATKPTILSGAMFENIWYVPKADSWMAQFIADANATYIFNNLKGIGSASLSFEQVLARGNDADFWIGPASFSSYTEMKNANPHYQTFQAFKHKKVYSYAIKKGKNGGILFYEDAPNRPDLVLKDLIKILYPNALPNYTPQFLLPLAP